MSDRNLDAGTAAALVQSHVNLFPLVQLDLDSGTSRVSGAPFDVEYPVGSGIFFLTVGGLGSMEPINETNEAVEGVKFSLAGVPVLKIIEAQQEKYQGRQCTVLWAFVDETGLHVDPAVWRGRLDVPTIERAQGTCTISITAEHSMADWQRKRELLFNHVSQKRIDPTDKFFEGIDNSKQVPKVVFSKAMRLR